MIWKDIKGYEGLYKISEFGDMNIEDIVKGVIKNKISRL